MKKLIVFLALLISLSLSDCNGITISFGAKNTPTPAAPQPTTAQTQQPPAAPRTGGSLIPPTSTPTPPAGAPVPTLQGGEAVIRSDVFTINTRELFNPFNLPGNNTAQLWRITAEMATGQAERTLRVEAQGNMPEGVSVGIYRLPNDRVPGGATPDGVLIAGTQPKNVYMRSYDALYIRAVSNQPGPRNVIVRVTEEFELEINPAAARLQAGGSQTFRVTRRGTNISPAVTWSVAEGPAGGAVSGAGVYTAPNQGGTYHVVAVATEGANTMRVSATVTVAGPTAALITPTPTPLGHGLGGAWVLRETRPKTETRWDDQFNKHQVTGTGGSVNTRVDWRSRTDNRSGTVTSTHTISPAAPPSRLVPGTNLEFKLERTLNTGGENAGASTGIFLYWEPGGGPDRSGTISTPAAENGSPNWSMVWNWKVPDKRNAKMHVQFTSSGPGGGAQTDYIYEWVE